MYTYVHYMYECKHTNIFKCLSVYVFLQYGYNKVVEEDTLRSEFIYIVSSVSRIIQTQYQYKDIAVCNLNVLYNNAGTYYVCVYVHVGACRSID